MRMGRGFPRGWWGWGWGNPRGWIFEQSQKWKSPWRFSHSIESVKIESFTWKYNGSRDSNRFIWRVIQEFAVWDSICCQQVMNMKSVNVDWHFSLPNQISFGERGFIPIPNGDAIFQSPPHPSPSPFSSYTQSAGTRVIPVNRPMNFCADFARFWIMITMDTSQKPKKRTGKEQGTEKNWFNHRQT